MRIHIQQSFEKRYEKLPKILQKKTLDALRRFLANPHEKRLKDYLLQGRLRNKRAFSVTGDVRVIYEKEKDAVLLLDVGTHAQVYHD